MTKNDSPDGFELDAFGDLSGRGVWTFRQAGEMVDITYLWEVSAHKPLLRRLSWLFKPIFAANHHWAMQTGYESLVLELARRHAPTADARARVDPPPPTFARRLLRQAGTNRVRRLRTMLGAVLSA